MATSSRTGTPSPLLRRGRQGVRAGLLLAAVLVGAVACSSTEEPTASETPSTPAADDGGDRGSTSTATASDPGDDVTSTSAVDPPDHGPLPEIDLDETEQVYVDALMEERPPEGMDDEQGECIAGFWVQAVGVDALAAAGITPEAMQAKTASITDLPLDRPTAEKVVDAYEACSYEIEPLVITGFASIAKGDPDVQACLEDAVTPEIAREYMILAVMASSSDGDPDMAEIQEVIAPCLSGANP